jgi:F420-dependent oxidoreductase-like protein
MRLGVMLGYSSGRVELPLDQIIAADQQGLFAVWTSEAYGSDCITPLAWAGSHTKQIHLGTAIMQMHARTPSMTAMTAMTLDQLSGGRFLLGLGLSGPQVVEGWHGQAYGKPLARTREYVEIVRTIIHRKKPLEHSGEYYQIPYQGEGASGLGKPLKSIIHGRDDIPIYLAAIGPKNVELTAEIADGWLPILFSPTHYEQIYKPLIEEGFRKAGGKDFDKFDIAPSVPVAIGDDLEACRALVKPFLALYIGGMGARGVNFYNALVARYGYEQAAQTIQDHYLSGRKTEAIAAIPDSLVDQLALCGPIDHVRQQLTLWRQSPITTLNIMPFTPQSIEILAKLLLETV